MAKNNPVEHQEQGVEVVESALSKTEQYIEDNRKVLSIVVIVILAIVGLYMAYSRFYKKPLEEEARAQMFVAEQYFEKDSFNLALKGDANYPGFLKIVDNYGSTKAGNIANYYIGICYMNLGDFDKAITYLKNFSTGDKMLTPVATGLIGDAYMEKNQIDEAISYYKKAAETQVNNFTSPIYLMKAAQAFEAKNNYKEALDLYNKIKTDYSTSNEGRTIDKYITRAKLKS